MRRHETLHALRIDWFGPMPAAFEFRADNKTVCICKKYFEIFRRYTGTEVNGKARFRFDREQIGLLRRVARDGASHNHSVTAHEFHRVGGFADVHVRRDGV